MFVSATPARNQEISPNQTAINEVALATQRFPASVYVIPTDRRT